MECPFLEQTVVFKPPKIRNRKKGQARNLPIGRHRFAGKVVVVYRLYYWEGEDVESVDRKYYMKVNTQNALTETDRESATLFQLESVGSSAEFKIILDGDTPKYIAATSGKDHIQVTEYQPHLLQNLSLEDDHRSFDDWAKEGARVKTEDGRYLGYCLKDHVVKCFPSGTEAQPGAVLLDCCLEILLKSCS